MQRRSFLKAGALGTALLGVGASQAAAQEAEKTGFVLVHGSWHGAWCWGKVEPLLNEAGHITVAIDLPGHGLKTKLPNAFTQQPADPEAMATEPSYLAELNIQDYVNAVLEGVRRAKAEGATRVILVGHSMGGVPISFAAAQAPEEIAGLVYVAAIALSPGNPGGAFLTIADPRPAPEAMTTSAFVAVPPTVGALRINPRETEPEYQTSFAARMAADVDDDTLRTIMHLITPDAPFNIYQAEAEFGPAFDSIPRTFVRCTADYAVSNAMADAMIAAMDAAWPGNLTRVIDIAASHEVMFSRPEETAAAIIAGA